MEIAKGKAKATLFALFLTLTIAVTFVASPTANAHDPIWKIRSFAYLAAQPSFAS
jgi:hypothetical protein